MFQKTAKLFCFLYSHSAVLKKGIRIYSTLPNSANEYALAGCNIQIQCCIFRNYLKNSRVHAFILLLLGHT